MFDEDWMMPGLKWIPNHQDDVLTREAGHIMQGEYLSRRCPMMLHQLGIIALDAQTPLPGRRRGRFAPRRCEAINNLAYTSQRRLMRGNDARLSKDHAESLAVGVADNDSHELRPAPSW
jgi:hypothetical protein